uniref:Uncharacterized protein n=1 Tax=Rhizophora mucronata TaxID=61149 RepID=A0A2P2IT62_RHIMU
MINPRPGKVRLQFLNTTLSSQFPHHINQGGKKKKNEKKDESLEDRRFIHLFPV